MNAKKLIALVLLTSLITPAASAAVKAGSSCKTLGQSSVSKGFAFTCVKNGKKLVWSKGVKQQGSAVTPASKYPAGPKSFSDLYENRKGIAYAVWLKASQAMSKNATNLPPIEIFRGPGTPTYATTESIKVALEDASKMFPNFPQPEKVVLLVYSRADLDWGIEKAKDLMGIEYENAFRAHGGPMIKCNNPTDCNDGDAFVGSNGVAYLAVGLPATPNSLERDRLMNSQTEITEYYHSLQEIFYEKNKSKMPNVNGLNPANKPPHWLNIGGENFASQLVKYKNNFEGFRKELADNPGFVKWIGVDFNSSWINDYLSISNLNGRWSSNRSGAPSAEAALMGQFILQSLIALNGPSVMLDFHKAMSAGAGFVDTFKKLFGVDWSVAQSELAKVIMDQYQNAY